MMHIDPKIVADARLTELGEISRSNKTTLFLPRIIDLKLAIATPNVLTLIPPAVDCDAPPIHIKSI